MIAAALAVGLLAPVRAARALVFNGDFELGDRGFSSDYLAAPEGHLADDQYAVRSDPSGWDPAFPACGDHTTGSGLMFMASGAVSPGRRVWEQGVAVMPNTNYELSFWALELASTSAANLRVTINGGELGRVELPRDLLCQWRRYAFSWNSGQSTTAALRIENLTIVSEGNDFALDDLAFSERGTGCGDVDVDGRFDARDPAAARRAMVDPEGSGLSLAGIRNCPVYGGERSCDLVQVVVMRRNAISPPLPPGLENACLDGDRDGVGNAADRCPETGTGMPLVDETLGCSVFDLVRDPEAALEPSGFFLRRGAGHLSVGHLLATPPIQDLVDVVASAQAELELAERRLRAGEVCDAAGRWAGALAALQAQRSDFEAEREGIRTGELSVPNPWDPSHFNGNRLALVPFDLGIAAIDRALAEASTVSELLNTACAMDRGTLQVQGRIVSIDDASGIIALDTGHRVFSLDQSHAAGLSEDQQVAVSGSDLGANLLLGRSITDLTGALPGILPDTCLPLYVEPYQLRRPYTLAAPQRHTAPGYMVGGELVLERGARLAAGPVLCPGGGGNPYRFSLSLRIVPAGGPPILLAHGLETRDDAVSLPEAEVLPANQSTTLRVTVRRHTCGPLFCLLTETRSQDFALRVIENGSSCQLLLRDSALSVEDEPDQFAMTRVADLVAGSAFTVADLGAPSTVFRAESCVARAGDYDCENGTPVVMAVPSAFTASSFPDYRVYAHDFHPLYRPVTSADLMRTDVARARHGVDVAYGLRWPHVTGLRNGGFFRYACGPSTSEDGPATAIVRDRLDRCDVAPYFHGDGVDTYYRYPFYPTVTSSYGTWRVSNGNEDDPTDPNGGHGFPQQFAWDWAIQEEAEIRAPRSGVITLFVKNQMLNADQNDPNNECIQANMNSSPCIDGNYLYLEHQDLEVSTYFHLTHKGVVGSLGFLMRRRHVIAWSGNTGKSGGPHLHFHVQQSTGIDDTPSKRVKFQTVPFTCHIPLWNDQAESNNTWPVP